MQVAADVAGIELLLVVLLVLPLPPHLRELLHAAQCCCHEANNVRRTRA
jgi:hypothetical protein